MRKVCVITGNRAEYSRVKSVMWAVQDHPELALQVVVTGAHLLRRYGESVKEIERDGFQIDARVHLIIEGENPATMAKSTGLGIIEIATWLENLRPDVVVAPTDRFETLSTAVAAVLMNLPVAHIQGGEVSGSIDESIRHAITKLAHCHFPATEKSRERIIRMGEDPSTVFNVGCPATDLVVRVAPGTQTELFQHPEVRPKEERVLDPEAPTLLVVQHPVTTEYGSGFQQIQETLAALKALGMQVVMFWPNVDAGSQDIVVGIRRFLLHERMERLFLYRHFSNEVFVRLMQHAVCMVGNSSAGIRETCYLGTPVVNIGTRQQDRERGHNVIDVPYDRQAIQRAIEAQVAHGKYAADPVYGDGTAGRQIADILARVDLKRIQKKLAY